VSHSEELPVPERAESRYYFEDDEQMNSNEKEMAGDYMDHKTEYVLQN
jgi:hypothetical protein